MGKLRIEVSEKTYSPVLFAMGTIFLILRLYSFMAFQEDHYFEPEISHVSYMASFLACLAMISSFRQPVLNAVPFVILPSYIITIPLWDFKILANAAELPPWEIINALTIHMPCFLMGIWIFINREELVSMHAIVACVTFGLLYFIVVDNKVNDVGINEEVYGIVVAVIALIWIYLLKFHLLKESKMRDPFSARLIVLVWKD